MNLIRAFYTQCDTHPNRVAIIDKEGRQYSFAELRNRAQSLADKWRAKGIRPGDKVLIAMGISVDLYATLAALWQIGAVAVLPEPALGLFGLRHAISEAKPKAVVLSGLYHLLPIFVGEMLKLKILNMGRKKPWGGSIDDYVTEVLPNHGALISFTSGTSGAPKTIVRSHEFMLAQFAAVTPLISTNGEECRDLVGFPVFVVANLGQGVTSILPNWVHKRAHKIKVADIIDHINRNQAKRLLLNPALIEELVDAGLPNGIAAIFTGGGPVFPDLMVKVKSQYPNVRMVCVYGSTEAEPIAEIAINEISDEDFAKMANCGGILAGAPVDCANVRIENDEIQVAGKHVVGGYLNPAHNIDSKIYEDDIVWHRTGDAGYFDDSGRLWLLGRHSGRVNNLWPFAVEVAARNWPGVKRAALVGVKGKAVLAIEGNLLNLLQWQSMAKSLGDIAVKHIIKMPMDKRHGSKINIKILAGMVR